ncbi:MAG TPA: VOC family protein [Actinomycetota bacterium]|nr:VOC family protein [Actinomycetota bacterium]
MAGAVRALGEVALRVNDLDEMVAFYENVIRLELMKRFERAAFFRIADGYAGHTAVLALFDRNSPVDQERSTIDHLAFTIALEDFESEKERLEAGGVPVTTTTHAWVHWRSLYIHDPEGNLVELVCYDPDA